MSEDEKKYGRGENPASQANLHKFGSDDPNPQSQNAGGNKPWSIRNSIRYLARQELDNSDKEAFKKILPPKPTVAQLIAANALAKATKADMRAVEFVTDQIDGKLAQLNLNGDLAALEGMTDDELLRIANGVGDANAPSSGEGDVQPPPGSKTPA